MKKCSNCGLENDDNARFCADCGGTLADAEAVDKAAPVKDDDPFANAADVKQPDAVEGSPAEQQDKQPQKGFKGKVVAVKNKTVEFEKKHSVILNALVIICALVVIFVSLFAPLKVVTYGVIELKVPNNGGMIADSYDVKGEYGEDDYSVTTTAHYVEIKQSIWQMIGAIGYAAADVEDFVDLQEEVGEAFATLTESDELLNLYEKLEKAEEDEDQDKYMDIQNDIVELYADCLSDVNILGYALAYSYLNLNEALGSLGDIADNLNASDLGDLGDLGDFDIGLPGEVVGDVDIALKATMTYIDSVYTLVFALVIVILSVVAAIVSLVYLIKAIIGLVKKKPQQKLYKYLGTMLGLSGTSVLLSMFAPLLSVGGGPLAVAVFISVVYFLCGLGGSLLFGKDGLVLTIKRGCIALFGMIAFFLLCSNIFSLTTKTEYATSTVNGAMGYGWVSFFNILTLFDSMDSSLQGVAVNLLNQIVPGITGFVTYIILFFAIIFAFRAYQRTLRRLAFGNIEKSSCSAFAITSVVFFLIAIIASMAVPGAIGNVLVEAMSGDVEIDLKTDLVSSFAIRAQVWVSMIFFLALAVVNIAFKPKSKNTEVAEGQQL